MESGKDEGFSAKNAQGSLITDEGKIWIPQGDEELQLRVILTAHCGGGRYRDSGVTKRVIAERVWWSTLGADVASFCQHCLFYKVSDGQSQFRVPFTQTLHASEPNQVLHLDYFYAGPSRIGEKYILNLKDDFSGFVRLFAFEVANGATAAEDLQAWFSVYVVV